MSPRRETVVVEADPPAYPAGYGAIHTVEIHHFHGSRGPRRSCSRAFLATSLLLLITLAFSVMCFVAWNFYNLSECEKNRLPWEKPCKDWLGKDSFFWASSGHH